MGNKVFVSYHLASKSQNKNGYGRCVVDGPVTEGWVEAVTDSLVDSYKQNYPDMKIVILNIIPLAGEGVTFESMWNQEISWMEWSCRCIKELAESAEYESDKARLLAKLDGMRTALDHMKGTARYYGKGGENNAT